MYIYLISALYLLGEGQSGMTEREQKLTNVNYDPTEDLLFVAGIFLDQERSFLRFKPQLLRLVGRERTMPVMGNMTAWNWFITWLAPNLKKNRDKDMAPFRVLCALSTAYVKSRGAAGTWLYGTGNRLCEHVGGLIPDRSGRIEDGFHH